MSKVTNEILAAPVPARFIVGIDLGTTNCAVAYVDTSDRARGVEVFLVEQWVDWQTLEKRTTLPSFHYQWTPAEASQVQILPKQLAVSRDYCVGVYARNRGVQAPGRQISSAKSWLCHSGADRTAAMLPWQGDIDAERISPVVASSRYLEHIRNAWDAAHPDEPLASCDVVLTLPASFDEVARELTIEAARLAGLPRIVLIEEPQAAFYAWLSKHESDWQQVIHPGQTVLICDIGGGTTDFTLIRVREEEGEQKFGLHRVAVGQHLMLGGDNFDLALAKAIEPLFFKPNEAIDHTSPSSTPPTSDPESLAPTEWESLRLQCRVAKEALLGMGRPSHSVISIAGRGSRLIGNVRSVDVSHEMAEQTLLEGFFPYVDLQAIPYESEGGLFEFGLPYAADPAITRHMAKFLWDHRWDGRPDEAKSAMPETLAARPDWILFNGGVLESPQIRERLLTQLNRWFGDADSRSKCEIGELESKQLYLAVAIGAAYFGLVRRGEGVRIDARLARAYYLQVTQDPPQALCIMPGDAIPLDKYSLVDHPFELEIGRPIQFPIFVSSTNLVHRVGEIVKIDEEHMRPLPPIQTVLESSRHRRASRVPIILETELTEIGTLDLALVSVAANHPSSTEAASSVRWRLAFDLRSTVETDRVAHTGTLEQSGIVDSELMDQAATVVQAAFQPDASTDLAKSLVKNLVRTLDVPRHEWKPSLLRSMWQTLIDCDPQQKRTAVMESRWLNLLGFCLRPGYGYAADDWRVSVTWRLVQGKLKHASNASEAMVLWRRIAGGFTAGQQRALFQEVQGRVVDLLEGGSRTTQSNQEAMELFRLVGSLELLGIREKQFLGRQAMKAIRRPKLAGLHDSILWMLGRLGARSLVYGPVNEVVPVEATTDWIRSLCEIAEALPTHQLALMQLTRRTGDRYRDVSGDVRSLSLRTLEKWSAPESYIRLVAEISALDAAQNETIIGEALPLGIRLRS